MLAVKSLQLFVHFKKTLTPLVIAKKVKEKGIHEIFRVFSLKVENHAFLLQDHGTPELTISL